jgi:hypothetical protein
MKFGVGIAIWAFVTLIVIVLYSGIAACVVSLFYGTVSEKFSLPDLSLYELWCTLIVTTVIFNGINPSKLLQILIDIGKLNHSSKDEQSF